jgi:DNA-binding NarL/FixJ family response regulator
MAASTPSATSPRAAKAEPPIRVLVVDDHPFLREGLRGWLNRQQDIACCGEADSALTARAAVKELQPDIVLLDLRLPDCDGLDLTRELCSFHPGLRILVVSQQDELTYAHRALKAGARGYVMKAEATDTVLTAIRTVMRGGVHISPSVSGALLRQLFPQSSLDCSDLACLTDRELQVFELRGLGHSNRAIAERLCLSIKTVETYCEKVKEKMKLPDNRALSRRAREWMEARPSPTSELGTQ